MNNKRFVGRLNGRKGSLLMTAVVIAFSFGCHKTKIDEKDLRDFNAVVLVANEASYKPKTTVDPALINGFGVAWSPGGTAWVNSVFGNVSELYNSEGVIVRPGVKIPSRTETTGGFPCGIVFSGGMGFNLANGTGATFLFSGFDGVLSGWNGGDSAVRILAPTGASYTGLAIGASGGQNLIYAANFGQKKIVVWDTQFHLVKLSFIDPTIPEEYSPYNIQAVGNYLFVMYAKLNTVEGDPLKGRPVAGAGAGFVSVFNMDGTLVKRFASRGTLNVPWGVTLAPASFLEGQDLYNGGGDGHGGYGVASILPSTGNDVGGAQREVKGPVILVGNFGDGHINVFSQEGDYLGQLQSKSRKQPLVIEGLWALTFPPSSAGIDPGRLYFSAGPDAEADGLFGYLIKQ
jgi:uncharacterized protein (TIGR03118 family)